MFTLLLYLVIAQTEITLPPNVIIYEQPEITSPTKTRTLDTLIVKPLYEVYRGDIYWLYIELPDGSKGFIPKVKGFKLAGAIKDTLQNLNLQDPCGQAQKDARIDINSTTWFVAGFFFGIFGVGAAYAITPNPPPTRLMGKRPEYISLYTSCYQQYARDQQVSNAAAGCMFWSLLWILLVVSGAI